MKLHLHPFSLLRTSLLATCLFFLTASFASAGINDGLVGYWTFDGSKLTTATATDSSGNGNDGTLVNSLRPTQGKIGQSLYFDGVDDYVITNLTAQDSVVTISAWIYPISLGEGNLGRILDKRENGGVETIYFALNGSNRLIFGRPFTSSANTSWATTVNSIKLNTWQHVVVTYNDSSIANDPILYINGIAMSITENQAPSGTARTNTDKYIIGNRGDTTRTFDGKIDDVRIYNRALSASEVQQLYKNKQTVVATTPPVKATTSPGLSNGLVGYWTFDGDKLTTATATDSSGNGNNGTLVSSPKRVQGKLGQGLTFDGSAQYINKGVLNTGGFTKITPFSGSAWIKLNSSDAYIMSNFNPGVSSGWYFYLNGILQVRFSNSILSSRFDRSSNSSLGYGKWYHVAFTYDGSASNSGIKLYIDGAEALSSGSTGGSGDPGTLINDSFKVGSLSGSSFNGSIDDVRVYNRVLSASEIAQLYKTGQSAVAVTPKTVATSTATGLARGLTAYYTFDGSKLTTATATDSSGNSRNGTLVNSPKPTQGKLGQGLKFNGTNSYVDLGTATFNSDTNNYTYSAWVKYNSFTSSGVVLAHGSRSFMYASTTGQPGFHLFTASTNYDIFANTILKTNTWYQMTVVKSSVTGINIYINGVLVLNSPSFTGVIETFGGDRASVGRYAYDSTSGNYIDGTIDDARFYNRALSAGEAQQLYKLGASIVR